MVRQVAELRAAIDREIEAIPDRPAPPATSPTALPQPTTVEQALAPRRAELDALSPLGDRAQPPGYGLDLTGSPSTTVSLDLKTAVLSAVRNNLDVRFARLQPAITQEEVIAAEAIFDAVLFGNVNWEKLDEPQTVPVISGIPLTTRVRNAESARFETGIRKLFETGGTLTVSTDLTRSNDASGGIVLFPDPAYNAAVRVGLTQPLLRGFGVETNTANIQLTRNLQARTVLDLHQQLLEVVAEVERAYWRLAVAERSLQINQWLVDVGEEVRGILDRRQSFDATPAQFADAVARVEQRKAEVIRARREVQAASDLLKTLVNDERLPVSSEAVVATVDRFTELPVEWSLADAVLAATRNRPEIERARLLIDDARIRQAVADNARLPLADLTAQSIFPALDNAPGSAYSNLSDNSFVNYLLGLAVEQPLGNDAAEAEYRRARLERSQTIIGFKREVQSVAANVKSALRDVVANFDLIAATRSFRIAQAENLRTLGIEEENLASLTPEFLNLKFTQQETLARAQQQEIDAIAAYNTAVADLHRAMGTSLELNGIKLDAPSEDLP
jgi:outer membrane protein